MVVWSGRLKQVVLVNDIDFKKEEKERSVYFIIYSDNLIHQKKK